MSKPWGGVGAWALEAERAEAEERDRAEAAGSKASSSGGPAILNGEKGQSFPSLKEAAAKPKKKKGVSLSLSEFTTGTYVGPGGARRDAVLDHKGLTHDEMLRLPTGPRERTAEEIGNSRLGGGFHSYGYGSGGGGGAAPPRRRSDFSTQDERSDFDQPSRADEVDNWASAKKFVPSVDSGRQERHGSLSSGGSSKADELENWSIGKKSAAPPPSRHSTFGSGFRDNSMTGVDSDRWVRGGGAGSLSSNGERERPKLVLDLPRRDPGSMTESVRSRPNPFGSARPREEVLAEKGLDWRKMEPENEVKRNSRPSSSQSSRPTSAHSSRPGSPVAQDSGEGATKPRPKVNPFGNAKPREVILQEKGMDWRKIDLELEHRRVERPETDMERVLKQEISNLKQELAKESGTIVDNDYAKVSTEDLRMLNEKIRQMEDELDQLTRELDDKVRFSQRTSADARPGSGSGRPGSGSGRPGSGSGRPSSWSVAVEDSFVERSRPRAGDSWGRHMDEQRGFERSRDSGSLAGTSSGRSKSREKW